MSPRYILTVSGRRFVAYEKSAASGGTTPTFRQVEGLEYIPARGSCPDGDTDQAGRFPGDADAPGKSIDERPPMRDEQQRRAAAWLAGCIDRFVTKHPDEAWVLAAGEDLHNAVLERLGPVARANLVETVRKNLVHMPAPELAAHFLSQAA